MICQWNTRKFFSYETLTLVDEKKNTGSREEYTETGGEEDKGRVVRKRSDRWSWHGVLTLSLNSES